MASSIPDKSHQIKAHLKKIQYLFTQLVTAIQQGRMSYVGRRASMIEQCMHTEIYLEKRWFDEIALEYKY
jgi:hypothetical protein